MFKVMLRLLLFFTQHKHSLTIKHHNTSSSAHTATSNQEVNSHALSHILHVGNIPVIAVLLLAPEEKIENS